MLEMLVSSRIRRTLFEYILSHSTDRFYLRGLAKDLGLSISPLRRELKRLEQAGVLKTSQEGNMVFYAVNPASPTFLELQRASRKTQESVTPSPISQISMQIASEAQVTEPVRADASSKPLWWHHLSTPVLIGVAGVGMVLMLMIGGLFYVFMTNQQLRKTWKQAVDTRHAANNSASRDSSSGVMRGNRWRVIPGGFGGFSTAGN